jgi:hypothetical protein
MNEKRYNKKQGFKNAYALESVTIREIDETHYNNIVCDDTLKWFRRLGGSESVQRNYTNRGYKVVKLISKSPNGSIKVVREFRFKD